MPNLNSLWIVLTARSPGPATLHECPVLKREPNRWVVYSEKPKINAAWALQRRVVGWRSNRIDVQVSCVCAGGSGTSARHPHCCAVAALRHKDRFALGRLA